MKFTYNLVEVTILTNLWFQCTKIISWFTCTHNREATKNHDVYLKDIDKSLKMENKVMEEYKLERIPSSKSLPPYPRYYGRPFKDKKPYDSQEKTIHDGTIIQWIVLLKDENE